MDPMREVQTRTRRAMARAGLRVADLAARTGRRYSDVRRSLLAAHGWRLDRLFDYAAALGIDPRELIPGAPPPPCLETPDRIAPGPPESRIAAAYAAGLAVRALGRIGAANRRKRR